ncbi:MAG: hypothetical protein NTX56_13710 [Proteobacteria bacterium]|nr:hypothetical protein [Pseudomonadota bacterium]
MGNFLDLDSGAAQRPLWLDSTDYTARLLEGGEPPWLQVADFLAWQRKAQGLVRSDVVTLPAAPVIEAMLAKHPQLRTAMAGKSRVLFPLKTLLADVSVREQLSEMLGGLRACFPGVVDEFDSAAMYVADFLRAFSESGLDIVLLDEAEGGEPVSSEQIEWYRPVLNIAMHYRWMIGLRLPRAEVSPGAVDGLGFFIAPRGLDAPTGIATPSAFWTGSSAPPCLPGQFRHAEIPADANPELVLDRIALLHQ